MLRNVLITYYPVFGSVLAYVKFPLHCRDQNYNLTWHNTVNIKEVETEAALFMFVNLMLIIVNLSYL